MHPDWARSLRDQCVKAGVPFFFKQWGQWQPTSQVEGDTNQTYPSLFDRTGDSPRISVIEDEIVYRVGKRAAGRLLDGQVWDQRPEVKQ